MKKLIPISTLREIIRYDPLTGCLTWLMVTPDMFEDASHSAETRAAIWNAKYPGKTALNYRDKSRPYAYGDILGRKYYAHRVAFALMAGRWPDIIDHIDGDKTNNRWENLREVSRMQNMQNAALRSDNASGHVGVSFDKSRQKWAAEIHINGKKTYLGRFEMFEDAVSARRTAQLNTDYTSRHGTKLIQPK